MKKNIIQKVLDRFDDDAEVKINKVPKEYCKDGGDGYFWTFSGDIDGRDCRLKLSHEPDGRYILKTTHTTQIEEVIG